VGRLRVRATVGVCVAVTMLAACTPGAGPSGPPSRHPTGGTVRVAAPGLFDPADWDPAFSWGLAASTLAIELDRCCLLRQLFSYSGQPVERGGGELRPDLAAAMPKVSADGLTWTIEMKPGLRYAPPYEEREIVTADMVEAIERIARVDAWDGYFSPVVGFDRFAAGRAETISGLETPEPHTLVVHVAEPTGDLPERLSLAGTSPIPPGAADGHDDDYIEYLIASGPYMIEGAQDLTPWRRPSRQHPLSGVSGRGLTLVRNPSWDRSTDELRLAAPDRIVVEAFPRPRKVAMLEETYPHRPFKLMGRAFTEGLRDAFDMFAAGRIDVFMGPRPAGIRKVASGSVAGSIVRIEGSFEVYAPLNLAVPPFDDPHVRRAVNLAIDRSRFGGATELSDTAVVVPTWHLVPPFLEGARIDTTWRPTWAQGVPMRGDLVRAAAEMRRSRYDTDGDGRCDGSACVVRSVPIFANEEIMALFTEPFARLGIRLRPDLAPQAILRRGFMPAARFGFTFNSGWIADYFNASTYFLPTWYGPNIVEKENWNFSLLGATPEQLRRWGYEVRKVPSIDARIERCMTLTGESQTACWTLLDQYLMERVVPTIPLSLYGYATIVSPRVVDAPIDVSRGDISHDRIVLAEEGGDSS
jgi:ABC-type transport system substrate-binding protein